MILAAKLMSAFSLSLVLVCNVDSQSAQMPNQGGAASAPAATSSRGKENAANSRESRSTDNFIL